MCVVLIPYIGKPLAILLATAGELAVIIWAVSSYKRIKKEAEASITECLNKAQNEKMKAQHYFEDHYMIIAFLPDDYWYPLATDYLIKVVSTKRATTLAEALNLFDAQLHRWKIEDINAQVLAQQQAQTAHLKSINVSSKTSAAANAAHLIFDIARKL